MCHQSQAGTPISNAQKIISAIKVSHRVSYCFKKSRCNINAFINDTQFLNPVGGSLEYTYLDPGKSDTFTQLI